ncbi:MAG: hypothetical protein IJG45_02205 [Oscillospiraceae bacterium]|nr:hypothetical protein [Oscillospiraceae bacterium]
MQNNSQFSAQQLKELITSPEGQRLLALLQQGGGENARRAAEEYQKGNVAEAQALLQNVMQSQEASDLLHKFGGK